MLFSDRPNAREGASPGSAEAGVSSCGDGQEPRPPGVPGAQRVDHLAFTVSDLDAAIDFAVMALGGELVYRLPPLAHTDGWMRTHLDVHPRASAEIALVRLGPDTNLELFAYKSPDHTATPRAPHDTGHVHLALHVTDVARAAAELTRRAGVSPLGPVLRVPDGQPDAGTHWVRLSSPFDAPLELRSVPDVLPYEAAGGTPRRRPPGPWRNRDDGTGSRHGLPGALGVDHFARTVADLDSAERFFVDVLGAELLYRSEYGALPEDVAAALGVPPGGAMRRAVLGMGPTDTIELASYQGKSAGNPRPPRNSDVGGSHIALHVRDVDAAAAYLAAHGCTVLGRPETIDEGPLTGDRWVYTRAPCGLYVEVVHMPDGALPYERGTAARRKAAHGLSWTDRTPPRPVRGTVPDSPGTDTSSTQRHPQGRGTSCRP
ncbi:VOC family protein [Streptomyces olivaceoviridis]|uniref:VOC family protein n=1 Tax=Streptomyces olivaceoviridis TaxID=1921 RepID=UPI0036BB7FFB